MDHHQNNKKRKRLFHQAPQPEIVAEAGIESDSEYEVEEVVELCEWYPPDFWKSSLNLKVRTPSWMLISAVFDRTRIFFSVRLCNEMARTW